MLLGTACVLAVLLVTSLHLRVLVSSTLWCMLLLSLCVDGEEKMLLNGAWPLPVIRAITTPTVVGAATLPCVKVVLVCVPMLLGMPTRTNVTASSSSSTRPLHNTTTRPAPTWERH